MIEFNSNKNIYQDNSDTKESKPLDKNDEITKK